MCEDCDDKGLLCNGPANKDALASIQMGNNVVSEYWGGGELEFEGGGSLEVSQTLGFPVIQSDVSGVWGIASPPEISKTDLSGGTMLPGSDPSLNMPFGYINNLIKIPRNLDGSGIVIDPSNILFPDNNCGVHSYFRNHTNIKTNIVIRGAINLCGYSAYYPIGFFDFCSNNDCTDVSYNVFENSFIQFAGLTGGGEGIFFGRIFNICCIGKKFGIPWFDIYIELYNVNDYNFLSRMINYTPSFHNGLPLLVISDHYKWDNFPFFGYLIYSKTSNAVSSITYDGYIESVSIFQGTCDNNQTTGNKVDQSYMSCLEDGTKKIKFT